MMNRALSLVLLAILLTLSIGQTTQPAEHARPEEPQPPIEGAVYLAKWIYATKKSACFAEGFLADLARLTPVKVQRTLTPVRLDALEVFEYPMAIMAGEGGFQLSDTERRHLEQFLRQGGFLLASPGCSSAPWADSFRRIMADLFPDDALTPLPMDHPIFHTIYDIDALRGKQPGGDERLWGLTLAGRLAVVFTPVGLNDSDDAGGGCCCCGGNELRSARTINMNITAYALTH